MLRGRLRSKAIPPLLLAAILSVPTTSLGQRGNPRDILFKGMQRAFSTSAIAIILQRSPDDGSLMQIKVEQSREGKFHKTWLQPLRYAGTETVDDGVRAQTYVPDARTIYEMDSPRLTACSLETRMKLAQQNYQFRFDGAAKIAGRQAVCVEAIPKHSEMNQRRFFLDSETLYLLRLELRDARGKRTAYDTISVMYPKNLPAEALQMSPRLGKVNRESYERLKPLANGSAKAFSVAIPKSLPLGFTVQEAFVSTDADLRRVGVRITDGLVLATVYQWKQDPSDRRLSDTDGRTVRVIGPFRLLLVSDMPPQARSRLLASFAAEFERRFEAGAPDALAIERLVLSTLPELARRAAMFVEVKEHAAERAPRPPCSSIIRAKAAAFEAQLPHGSAGSWSASNPGRR